MAEGADERAAAIERTATAVQGLDPAAQAAAIKAVVPPPDETTTNELWKALVIGLLILIGMALVGLTTALLADKKPDLVLTAFTALLTGLIGLFAPSPVAKGAGEGNGA